jgi:hypothetical protein
MFGIVSHHLRRIHKSMKAELTIHRISCPYRYQLLISQIWYILTRFLLLYVVTILFTGCAVTYNIKEDMLPTPTSSAMVQQLPLTVGVFIPPSVKSLVIAKALWRTPTGEVAASTFHWALAQMFTKIVELDTPPTEGIIPSGLAGIFELSDILYEYPEPSALTYRIQLYSSKGEIIKSWSLTAQGEYWDLKESSMQSLLFPKGTELAYRIRDVTALFMVGLIRSPEVNSWLTGEGIKTYSIGPIFRDNNTVAKEGSAILLVSNTAGWLYTDDSRGMDCVGNRLGQMVPAVNVFPLDNVRLEFFPWLEMTTEPKTEEETQEWISEPAIQKKMHAIGIRYLLEFQGDTNTKWKGGILCGGGPGGGGCLGFSWGDRNSSFRARILDIWTGKKEATNATKSGTSFIPAFILPIPIIASTEQGACEELSQKIHHLIVNERP